MWQCPECNEGVEPPLDVCWNCGTSRAGDLDPDFKRADDFIPVDAAELREIDQALLYPRRSATPTVPKIRFSLRALFGALTACAVLFAAIAWFAQPRTAKDFYCRGMSRLKSGQNSGAVADLTRSLELRKQEGSRWEISVIFAARAAAHNNQGNYAKSLSDISRAIELVEPAQPPISTFVSQRPVASWHLLRANSFIGLGQQEKAISDLKMVLQLEPGNRHALRLLEIAEGRKPIAR